MASTLATTRGSSFTTVVGSGDTSVAAGSTVVRVGRSWAAGLALSSTSPVFSETISRSSLCRSFVLPRWLGIAGHVDRASDFAESVLCEDASVGCDGHTTLPPSVLAGAVALERRTESRGGGTCTSQSMRERCPGVRERFVETGDAAGFGEATATLRRLLSSTCLVLEVGEGLGKGLVSVVFAAAESCSAGVRSVRQELIPAAEELGHSLFGQSTREDSTVRGGSRRTPKVRLGYCWLRVCVGGVRQRDRVRRRGDGTPAQFASHFTGAEWERSNAATDKVLRCSTCRLLLERAWVAPAGGVCRSLDSGKVRRMALGVEGGRRPSASLGTEGFLPRLAELSDSLCTGPVLAGSGEVSVEADCRFRVVDTGSVQRMKSWFAEAARAPCPPGLCSVGVQAGSGLASVGLARVGLARFGLASVGLANVGLASATASSGSPTISWPGVAAVSRGEVAAELAALPGRQAVASGGTMPVASRSKTPPPDCEGLLSEGVTAWTVGVWCRLYAVRSPPSELRGVTTKLPPPMRRPSLPTARRCEGGVTGPGRCLREGLRRLSSTGDTGSASTGRQAVASGGAGGLSGLAELFLELTLSISKFSPVSGGSMWQEALEAEALSCGEGMAAGAGIAGAFGRQGTGGTGSGACRWRSISLEMVMGVVAGTPASSTRLFLPS